MITFTKDLIPEETAEAIFKNGMKKNFSLYDLGYEAKEGIDGIDIWNVKTNKKEFHLDEQELFQHATPLKIWQLVYDKINALKPTLNP